MDNIISNVNSIYTNGTYASGTGNSLEDKINNKVLKFKNDDGKNVYSVIKRNKDITVSVN